MAINKKGGDNKRKRSHDAGQGAGAAKPQAKKARPSPGGKDAKPRSKTFEAAKHKSAKPAESREQKTTNEKRSAVREKKIQLKKNFGTIHDAVLLWEKMRPKETSQEEKQQLAGQIMGKIRGKVMELSNHHTASRIIQFCSKHGSEADRKAVLEEVRSNVVELSKSKYGHHLVKKLINVCKKEEVPALVRLFRGHIVELLRQPYGADVLVDLYDVAPTALRNSMCAEFYGKEFALFDGVATPGSSVARLKDLMGRVPASKQRAMMQHMARGLVPIMEKALLHPPMVHRLLRDYLECAPASAIEDAVDTLSQAGSNVLKLVHTHEGAAVACMLLAYGSPRDRKRLVKAMKGFVKDMAINEWGHAVLCTAISVVDDTALMNKVVVAELKAMLEEALEDKHASRVLLHLLSPDNRRYQPMAVLELVHPPQRVVKGSSGKMVTDLEGDEDDAQALLVEAGTSGGDADGPESDALLTKKMRRRQKERQNKRQRRREALEAGDGSGGDGDEDEDGEEMEGEEEEHEHGEDCGCGHAHGPGAHHHHHGQGEEDSEEEDGEGASDASGERILGLSKKDGDQRRRELLGQGKAALSTALTAAVAGQAGALLRSRAGCDVVVEVATGGQGALLLDLCPEGVKQVHEAIASEVAQPSDGGQQDATAAGPGPASEAAAAGPGPAVEHVLTHYYASRALRRLVLASALEAPGGRAAQACVELLWSRGLAGRCKAWLGGHAEKVLAALLHSGVPAVVAAATKELQPAVKAKAKGMALEQWANTFLQQPQGEGPEAKRSKKKFKQQQKRAAKAAAAGGAAGVAAGSQPANQAATVPGPAASTPAAKGKGKGAKTPGRTPAVADDAEGDAEGAGKSRKGQAKAKQAQTPGTEAGSKRKRK